VNSARPGLPASPGIAIAPAFVLQRERLVIPEYRIPRERATEEVERLRAAFAAARERLGELREGIEGGGLVANIFDAQFLFLEDPSLIEQAERNVRELGLNAEWALQRELGRLSGVFEGIADPYIRARASDVSFVGRRVLQELMGREPEGLANAPAGVVVVAEDLSPAEMAQFSREQVAGIATEAGSRTSHVTIVARSLEIPAVVGVGGGLVRSVQDGALVIVDGNGGQVWIEPEEACVAEYGKRRSEYQQRTREFLRYVDLPAETRDGVEARLLANVDLVEEIRDVLRYGAEGIGLLRTEFLFMNRSDLPDEAEQEAAYREILSAVAPRSVVVRTLDIGGEKIPSGLGLSHEPNPALGLRGLRLSQTRPEVFRTQLRALLRASPAGHLQILVPMVSGVKEIRFARERLREVEAELRGEGIEVNDRVELGAMIETPAAAMIADLIVPYADFLSIGTNDLLQYTLAVDRTNEHVAYLYEPLHPAHLRMIRRVAQAARRAGIRVGMCGEMAGDPLNVWVLLALGVEELSMAPFSIPLVKKIVRESTLSEARSLLADLLRLPSAPEVRERVERVMGERFPLEFDGLPSRR
jgi:phosphotransferase system enzyme I (PtsI)